jgi:hypothetical protein
VDACNSHRWNSRSCSSKAKKILRWMPTLDCHWVLPVSCW